MPHIWDTTLANQKNQTCRCQLRDVPDAIAFKRLEMTWEDRSLVAVIEPKKDQGVYLKEVLVLGEHIGFSQQNGLLLPAHGDLYTGRKWQLSAEKKNRMLKIFFKMDMAIVSIEAQKLVIEVTINLEVRTLFKQGKESVFAVIELNPTENFKIQRIELNGAVYEDQA